MQIITQEEFETLTADQLRELFTYTGCLDIVRDDNGVLHLGVFNERLMHARGDGYVVDLDYLANKGN